jgi:hypothetical protein
LLILILLFLLLLVTYSRFNVEKFVDLVQSHKFQDLGVIVVDLPKILSLVKLERMGGMLRTLPAQISAGKCG